VRGPMSAPPPTSTRLTSKPSDHAPRLFPESVKGRPSRAGSRSQPTRRSRSAAKAAATRPAPNSHRPAAEPWPSCIERIVCAVATDWGKASCSRLISWRLMGIAANTPSAAITANQANIARPPGRTPVRSKSAGSAAMFPPPVIHAAADATDATALFSSAENGLRTRPRAPNNRKAANASTVAVMVMPRLQPVLRTT